MPREGSRKRIVDLDVLGENLRCRECQSVLSLTSTIEEKCVGLHSVLTVKCDSCKETTKVETSNKSENGKSEVTASIVVGKYSILKYCNVLNFMLTVNLL